MEAIGTLFREREIERREGNEERDGVALVGCGRGGRMAVMPWHPA